MGGICCDSITSSTIIRMLTRRTGAVMSEQPRERPSAIICPILHGRIGVMMFGSMP
jgi:hypothetical protein